MRVAAGVLLILCFIINGIAGLGYVLGGAVVGAVGQATEEVGTETSKTADDDKKAADKAKDVDTKKTKKEIAADEKKTADDLKDEGKKAKQTGGLIALFGLFLVALCITELVLAILLFMNKHVVVFGWIVAVLGIGAEVGGAALIKFGAMNIPGLVAALLVIIWAVTAKKDQGVGQLAVAGGGMAGAAPYPQQPMGYGAPPQQAPYGQQPQAPYGQPPPGQGGQGGGYGGPGSPP